MKVKLLNTIKFFVILIVAVFMPSFLASSFLPQNVEIVKTVYAKSPISGIVFSYEETGSGNVLDAKDPSFVGTYKAGTYQIKLSHQLSGEYLYQWQKLNQGVYENIDGATTNVLDVSNCDDSGLYKCLVTDAVNTDFESETKPISIIINKYQIQQGDLKIEDKEFDGTNNVVARIVNPAIENDDGVRVSGFVVDDVNAGNGKFAYNEGTLQLVGENKNNYILSVSGHIVLKANILKKPVVFSWNNPNNHFTYNGEDKIKLINPTFTGIDGIHNLFTTISAATSFEGSSLQRDAMKSAGIYTISIVPKSDDANYLIKDANGQSSSVFYVDKKFADVTLSQNEFTYDGLEHNLDDYLLIEGLKLNEFLALEGCANTITTTNKKFTTVAEGNSLEYTVNVTNNKNYTLGTPKILDIVVSKAIPELSTANLRKYYYNGQVQMLNTDDLQIVGSQDEHEFVARTEFLNAGKYDVVVKVSESENYVARTFVVPLTVEKKIINVSNFVWDYNRFEYRYGINKYEVRVEINQDSQFYDIVYTGDSPIQTGAGMYRTLATFTPRDENNCEIVGSMRPLDWSVAKFKINIPQPEETAFDYTGNLCKLNIPETSLYYRVSNYEEVNAGKYVAVVELLDTKNVEWEDETIKPRIYNWEIKKAVLQNPTVNISMYSGKSQIINISSNDKYFVICDEKSDVGNYTAYIVLKDFDNYEWENSETSVLQLQWSIQQTNEKKELPIVAIIFTILCVGGFATYLALRFKKLKRRRNETVKKSKNKKAIKKS